MKRLHARQNTSDSSSRGISVPECGPLSFAIPINAQLNPPYTLIAYSAGGYVASAYPLTVDRLTASWTVVYPAPMLLALDIVDSKGSPVGTPTEYKVQPTNSSKACLPSSLRHTSSVSIAIESTDPKMCTPLNIRIDGGQKPYTVTFAPVGSATVNITMGANDDSLYWINTFPPPTAFYVAASDSQGIYAITDSYQTTSGSKDASCPSQVTRSFNSRDPSGNSSTTTTSSINNNIGGGNSDNNENNSKANNQNDGRRIAAIVGGTVGAILLLALVFILFRRRNGYGDERKPRGLWRRHKRVPNYSPDPISYNPIQQTYLPPTPLVHSSAISNTGLSYYADPPSSPGQAGFATDSANSSNGKPVGEGQEIGVPASRSVNSDVQVHQHTDAGRVIELPPAYGDVPTH